MPAHGALLHFVGAVPFRQLADLVRGIAFPAQVGCGFQLPVRNEAGMLHVPRVIGYDHLLAGHGLHRDLAHLRLLVHREVEKRPVGRFHALRLHRAFRLHVDGGVGKQRHGLILRQPLELPHAHLLPPGAVRKAPAHALVEAVLERVVQDVEHVPPEHHLVDVQRGVLGRLLLLRRARLEAHDLVAAEHAQQAGHCPLHRFHHRAVNVGGKPALCALVVRLVAVAQVLALELRAAHGKLPAVHAHAVLHLAHDAPAQGALDVFFLRHQQTLRFFGRAKGLKPFSARW